MILQTERPPSSSGLGYLVLSQGTGVRVPVGVLPGHDPIGDSVFSPSAWPRSQTGRRIGSSMIEIEFYGVPRLRAGTSRLRLEASSVGQALRELGRTCPTLENSVLRDG